MLLDPPSASELATGGRGAARALSGTLIDVDSPEWEAVLRTAAHDCYHRPAYVALSAAVEHGRACALHVTDGDRAMLLPLIVREIPGGGSDVASPYGYPGPIGIGTDDPSFLRLALVAGLQVLRDARLVSAFVRLHPLLNPSPPVGVGALVEHGETVSIDLTLPSERLWAQMRRDHRHAIARASRLGFVAHMDEEWRHQAAFRRLYRATMARRSAVPFYFFDDAYFDGLRDALGTDLHLCVVERDGDVAAAGLFIATDGIVQYHLSGSDDAFRMFQPSKLMVHFASLWAKERGNRVLHLGGGVGAGNDSLMEFKTGFSPRRHMFETLRFVIDEQEYRRLVEVRDPQLDPDARTGFFPLYRHA